MQSEQAITTPYECAPFRDYWRDKSRDRRARRFAEALPGLLRRRGLRQRIRNHAALVELTEAVALNLVHAAHWHRRVLVSRDTSHRNPLPPLLDDLEALGFIRQWKAPRRPHGGVTSEVEALPALLDAFAPVHLEEIDASLRAVVELRDDDGLSRPVPARALRALAPPINRLNRILRAAVVDLDGEKFRPQVRRVFNGDLEHGGRWYHRLQNLSKDERGRLLINGEPVVELDYSALHPRLIYAREGIAYPLDADPYAIPGVPRKAAKGIWLQVMNDTSISAAVAHLEGRQHADRIAAHERYRAELEAWQATPLERRPEPPMRPACLGPTFEPFAPEIDVKAAVDALLDTHAAIAHTFNTEGQALELQHTDARIAERVITRCVERRWAVLPVHDSFIVQERHAQALRSFMADAYAAETGGHQCPIK
jgi:hypothetical protein